MKKFLAVVSLLLWLILTSAVSAPAAELFKGGLTSKLLDLTTEDAVISGPGIYYGIVVQSDGTNNCTISAYDNATVSATTGQQLIPPSTVVLGTTRLWAFSVNPGIKITNGISVQITAAGAGNCAFSVSYDQ
jgi:hypothetical protein